MGEGHQDDEENTNLSHLANMNILANKLAGNFNKGYGSVIRESPILPLCPSQLQIRGITISSKYKKHIVQAVKMPGQGSRHITVADLKTDHVGPLLKALINKINQAQRELPEKERTNKKSLDALTATKWKLELTEETRNELKKRGIKLMTELQKVNKEKKKNEEAQTKVQEEFDCAKRKSSDSQEDVDHLTQKLSSAQKAQQTLKTGRAEITELQAAINASGKEWMAKDVTWAGDKVLNHLDD